jgi:amino-acid N-acetyltransferase
VHIYPRPPAAKAKELLTGCNLPVSDLDDGHFEHFFGCGAEGEPKGVVGVELHGELGLLRSLAVDAAVRGRGCGSRLVAEAEQHALEFSSLCPASSVVMVKRLASGGA